MNFSLDDAVFHLARTPHTLHALLDGMPDAWARANYGPDTFSPFDVVGHLIHGEKTDWITRLHVILKHGDSQPFEPFDRYAMYETSKGKTVGDLLSEFETERASSLAALHAARLTPAHLELKGMHRALGSVTLKNLLATWVTHDLHHIAQICKAMARQYTAEVGPWRQYISILG